MNEKNSSGSQIVASNRHGLHRLNPPLSQRFYLIELVADFAQYETSLQGFGSWHGQRFVQASRVRGSRNAAR